MSEYNWNNSKCVNGWLHRFKIIDQHWEGVTEVCEICGKKKFFEVVNGRTDNNVYIAYHNRQCLNPLHNLFKREFPNYAR